ncbi:MAG: ADP-ribosylglycohydrolase family protein, partial [Saprospiraceae bacterium]|nr:ADP-ribosylglycohydrolase family protein [Saprospiraceae bacterium]
GVTYGGPTEFRYNKTIIPDSVEITWSDTTMRHTMQHRAGLYDDIYMDLTFVEVMEREGLDAPASAHAQAYANAKYWLWHANQQGRYNILHGILPPESGHWLNNPHADDIDFQIEADFAGIMSPGMPNSAVEICDKVGHIMNYGDGYYGGVFVAGMYTFAFVENDIPGIVKQGLSLIPKESTFYQCIEDVIKWHEDYPGDWKKNWQLIEEKWGMDIGCPNGAFRDFNIDAKINAAYVVLGLLYGEGDLGKTMEIATRAGQDSDCNPATAGAIVGTVSGYDNIPDYWGSGLASIEDTDFLHTSISLNDAYEISYKHALELIRRNGGEITESVVKIRRQEPETVPLEKSFPGYVLADNLAINKRITSADLQELEVDFEGIGIVLKGRARHLDFDNKYALLSEEETLDNYRLIVECSIDGQSIKTMQLPLNFVERAHEIFYQYELPEGKHTLKVKITNPHERAYLDVTNAVTYRRESE